MNHAAFLLPFALALQPAPAEVPAPQAAVPQLSLEQRGAVRCAAAFALVAGAQGRGEAWATRWPDLSTRGKEYFVRSSAQLMDELALDRAGIDTLVQVEVLALRADFAGLQAVMPACLVSLDAAGL